MPQTDLVSIDTDALTTYLTDGGAPGYPCGQSVMDFSDIDMPGNAVERLWFTARDAAGAVTVHHPHLDVDVYGNDDSDMEGGFIVQLTSSRASGEWCVSSRYRDLDGVLPSGADVNTPDIAVVAQTVCAIADLANRVVANVPRAVAQAADLIYSPDAP